VDERTEQQLENFEAALEKPEEELRAPKSLTKGGLACLLELIKMAQDNKMLTAADAAKATAILKTNPHMRLSKISRRLRAIEDTVSIIKGVDSRLNRIVTHTREELELTKSLCPQEPKVCTN